MLSGLLVTAVFLTATMGLSVHYCAYEKTPHVLLLYSGGDCGHVHDHDHTADNHVRHDNHDGGCCNTRVFSLDGPSIKGNESHTIGVVETLTPPDLFPAVTTTVSIPARHSLFHESLLLTVCRIPSLYADNGFAPLRL
jgi:hypothetical protein